MTVLQYKEENNYPKAFAATGAILVFMAALCYFIVFQTPPKQDDGTGGILVNYGTTDEGMGKDVSSMEQPSVSPKANHAAPEKVTPAPPTPDKTVEDKSDKKVVTQNTDDAPVVDSKSKKSTAVVATQPTKPAPKQVVNQAALFKGNTNKGTGSGDGTTNTPGNQGSPNGSTLVDNYGKGGSGNGLSLANWSLAGPPPDVKNMHRIPGVVVIDFIVDQNGNVTHAQANRSQTHATLELSQECEEAMLRTKFKPSTTVSGDSRGHYTFRFQVD